MMPPSSKPIATVLQLARLGDLAQTWPLIRTLQQDYTVRLICDAFVNDWASQLPGLEAVRSLDTKDWRSRCHGRLMEINVLLNDLREELRSFSGAGFDRVIPLNDFPVANLLAAGLCAHHKKRWVTEQLLLVRSYVRLIGSVHPQNRIHLSDLWISLISDRIPSETQPYPISSRGTQFAQTVLESFKRRKIKQIWAVILGSGAKYRRLEPEDMAAWWASIPQHERPALVLIGGADETELAARFLSGAQDPTPGIVNLVGACSPEELLGIFSAVDLVIGVDTGPLHWAAVVGTKVLGLYFGEAGFHDTGPYGEGHRVLWPDCPEYPCHPSRAASCNWRCRQAFQNRRAMAEFLTSLAAGDNSIQALPPGLRSSISSLKPFGNCFHEDQEARETPENICFAKLARRVLGLDQQGGDETYEPPPPVLLQQVQRLGAVWMNEIEQLRFTAAISPRTLAEVQTAAVSRVRGALSEITSKTEVKYENTVAERCVLSRELEGTPA